MESSMSRLRQIARLSLVSWLFFIQTAVSANEVNASQSEAVCADTLAYSFKKLASEEVIDLCSTYQGKVIMVVNTASKCGYTYQYEGLENLYKVYGDRDFVVLGFPSNDFANQEPGNEDKIQEFCRLTYGVKFPMFAKTSFKGESANPFFTKLAEYSGSYPQWNFHKYLIDRSGRIVDSFPSAMDPQDSLIIKKIEAVL